MIDVLKIIPSPLDELLVIAVFFMGVYFAWRSSRNKQQSEAIVNYEAVTKSQEVRLNDLESKILRLTDENHDLRAQVNQLIGENRTLKEVVAKPDPSFNHNIEAILKELKVLAKEQVELRKEFVEHSKQDDKRFAEIATSTSGLKTEILANRDFYAKTIKEIAK